MLPGGLKSLAWGAQSMLDLITSSSLNYYLYPSQRRHPAGVFSFSPNYYYLTHTCWRNARTPLICIIQVLFFGHTNPAKIAKYTKECRHNKQHQDSGHQQPKDNTGRQRNQDLSL